MAKQIYKPKLVVCKNNDQIATLVSKEVIKTINAKPNCVLGLPTGAGPKDTYAKLVEAFQAKKVDFSEVKSFNLDEYVDLNMRHAKGKYAHELFANIMYDNLFRMVNIRRENIHFPRIDTDCKFRLASYDRAIKRAGGIDLQLLGLGTNGHIAFNEPGTKFSSKTHRVKIADSTRESNKRFFDNDVNLVPTLASTMGVKSIFKGKKQILICPGANKADAIAKLMELKVDPEWTCTYLLWHPDLVIYTDAAGASKVPGMGKKTKK